MARQPGESLVAPLHNGAATMLLPREIEQDPRHLAYALFIGEDARAFSTEALTIVQQARIAVGRVSATLAVIGQSHFVSIERDDGRPIAVELLACIDPCACGARPTVDRTYRDVLAGSELSLSRRAIHVTTQLGVRSWRGDDWAMPPPSFGESGVILVHAFPGTVAARTIVGARVANACELHISTVHEYISDRETVVVTTETSFSLQEAA